MKCSVAWLKLTPRRGVAIGAVDDVKAQKLLLGFGEGTIDHHALARAAQDAGAFGRAKPRRRPDAPLLLEAVVHLAQLDHQRRILLRAPGCDSVFHVIGEQGIEHGLPRWGWMGGAVSLGRFGAADSDI